MSTEKIFFQRKMKAVVATLAGLLTFVISKPLSHLGAGLKDKFESDRVVKFEGNLDSTVLEVLQNYGADHFGLGNFKISKEAATELRNLGVELNDVTEEWIKHFQSNFEDENFMCLEESCSERTLDDFYSSYQSLASLHARAKSNAAKYANAEVISIGKSYEGREQLGVKFGVASNPKPLAFIFCNIHAREWLTPMFCSYLIEQLVNDGKGHPILNTYDFTVIVSANPDGYEFTVTNDNMWRKTRRPNTDVGNTRCFGTDPNRNYEFGHCGEGTSNNPCSDVYCGPTFLSEIETKNIVDYANLNKDRLIFTFDCHAYGYMFMFPYSAIYEQADEPDYSKQMSCTEAAVSRIREVSGETNKWTYGPVHSTIYPAGGTSIDYMYVELGVVYAYTAEVRGSSFQPATNQIMPSNIEIFEGTLASLSCVAANEGLTLTYKPEDVAIPSVKDDAPCKMFFC